MKFILCLLALDNILITAFDAAGWKDTFLKQASKFLTSILVSIGNGIKTSLIKKSGQALNIYLILCVVLLTAGCASGGMTGLCLNIAGTEMSAPYIGGKINANGVMCHIGCDSFTKCTIPTANQLKEVMTTFINNSNGKMSIPGPGTITFTPISK